MRISIAAILVFVLLLPQFSNGQNTPGQKATLIFNLIYNQKYDDATRELETEKSNIGSLYYGILSIDLAWWRYISTRKSDDLAVFLRLCNESKDPAQGKSPDNILRLVDLNYLMRFEVKQGNYLKAGFLHLKIKSLIKQAGFNHTTPEQTRLIKLYQYLYYYFEKKYIPFSSNPEGISRAGLLELLNDFCSDSDLMVNSLSNYFLGKIYFEVEKQPEKATAYFRTLAKRFPSNRIFAEFLRDSMQKN